MHNIKEEIWAWDGVYIKRKFVKLIHLTFFRYYGRKEIVGLLRVMRLRHIGLEIDGFIILALFYWVITLVGMRILGISLIF